MISKYMGVIDKIDMEKLKELVRKRKYYEEELRENEVERKLIEKALKITV